MKIGIIGNGVAGITVAETVRNGDKSASITIFSDEAHPHYSRPRLIELLNGKTQLERIIIHGAAWYEKNAFELLLDTKISAVDPLTREVMDVSGRKWLFDTIIIASGAHGSVPSVPGMEHERIFTLRTIADAEKIRSAALSAKRAAIIGGGLTGLETAFALVGLGLEITVIEMYDHLLPRQLDHESSGVFRSLLENRGIRFLTATSVRSVGEKREGIELLLSNGNSLPADFAVVAAGINPRTRIVENTSITRNRAIIVDRFMRTSAPGIYACGDVAECDGVIYGLWMPSREQGIACGNHLLGKETEFAGAIPSTRLKVAGIEFASIGDVSTTHGTAISIERDETSGFYKKLFLRNEKLSGAILIGNVKEAIALQARIRNEEK